MPFTIRTVVNQSDFVPLYAIEEACFTKDFRWGKTEFATELKKRDIWILEEDGALAGFLLAKIDRGMGYILTVEVPEKLRGKGYGAALVEACEKTYKQRGYSQVRLEVYTENPAQIMYFKLGYRVNNFKKDYYEKGKSAISMVKSL